MTHYSGEDKYSDGPVEEQLLTIARDYATVEYPRIIAEEHSWPILYHLSPLRENIVEWLPMDASGKVLEIGSGCGAVTGVLTKKAGTVDAVDLSFRRSQINAYRHMDCENLTIHVGNFQDVEPDLPQDYDLVCLIGVFEYGRFYIDSETPYEDFLKIAGRHCKPDGRIVIAIENQFGLKYWAGCKEDHLGSWFSGLEGYPNGDGVRTFSREKLLSMAKDCGFSDAHMYYPYPDYKFMHTLYSDERLPRRGELSDNLRNFDRDRLLLFDEKKVYDALLSEGQFPFFANSYLLILGPKPDVSYVKYSNERDLPYQIKTVQTTGSSVAMPQDENLRTTDVLSENAARKQKGKQSERAGMSWIVKAPLQEEAASHVAKLEQSCALLEETYADGSLIVNHCTMQPDGSAAFPYVVGETLEERLDRCLAENRMEDFYGLFAEYWKRISGEANEPDQKDAAGTATWEAASAKGDTKRAVGLDYDMAFSNIIITPAGEWHLIDYEWMAPKPVELRAIAFRAVYCYLLADENRDCIEFDRILQMLHVTDAEADAYRQQEAEFQKKIQGKMQTLAQIREAINEPVWRIEDLHLQTPASRAAERVQIYEDLGEGFSEENSFFQEERTFTVTIPAGRKALRIDPCSYPCLVVLRTLSWNGEDLLQKGKAPAANGSLVGDFVYAFPTADPGFTLSLKKLTHVSENTLEVSMDVTPLPEETLQRMAANKGGHNFGKGGRH